MSEPKGNTSKKPSRIPLLEPEEMSPEQRVKYDSEPNAQINLSRLLGQARTLAPEFIEFNVTMATEIDVPAMEREIVCLAVLHLERGEYEWAQHMRGGQDDGNSPGQGGRHCRRALQ